MLSAHVRDRWPSTSIQRRATAVEDAFVGPLILASLMVVAALARLVVAARFPAHVDEGNMLLGIHTVAEKGYPLLPSGVLYIHGATMSYLLAPLVRLGLLDYTDLAPLRAVNAICGAVAVYLTFRLARDSIRSNSAALFAAGLVALDPLNVLWGGFTRMYALLQVLILLVVWMFLRAIGGLDPGRRRALVVMTVAFWLAVFTHAVATLLWFPLAFAAVILFGSQLRGPRQDFSIALGISALAPVTFIALSSFVGYGSTSTRSNGVDTLPIAGFLGDDAFDLARLLDPQPIGITQLFFGGPAARFVPLVISLLTGILLGVCFLRRPEAGERINRTAIGTLMLVFWTPALLFAFIVGEQKERYLLGVLPMAYILSAGALAAIVWAARSEILPRWLALAGVGMSVGLLLLHVLGGLWTLDEWGVSQTEEGHALALQYVKERRGPDDWTIVGSTPEAYLVLGAAQPIRAIRGVLGRPGSVETGAKVDDWIGWEVLDAPDALCDVLRDHPGTWLVLSGDRPTPGSRTADIVAGASEQLYRTDDGFRVLRSLPETSWNAAANVHCVRAGRPA